MELSCFGAPFEVKFLDEDTHDKPKGSFEGYGAVFGNIDSYGDVIEPGAFAASLLKSQKEGRALPPMYKMHGAMMGNVHEPIGVWEAMSEDTNGLHVKGRLIGLDTEQGKWNYAQLRDGALRGLSIGFSVPPHGSKRGSDKPGEPRRYLKTINLREVSLVDNPANARAQVYAMKARASAYDLSNMTVREFEAFLRDVGGCSNAEAKAIASSGFKAKADPRDEDATAEVVRTALRDSFAELAAKIHSR